MGDTLNKIHDWITKIIRNGQFMTVLVNFQKEHKKENCACVQAEVLNFCNSRYDETRSANMNHIGLDISIRRMVCPGGVDVDLYDEYNRKYKLHNIVIQADEWDLYQQYESGLQSLRYYSLFTQHSTVIVHRELF